MFIQKEATPNPNAQKFLPGIVISDEPLYFQNKESSINSSLVRKLFNINGVEGVFLGSDFITVTKNEDSNWQILELEIITTIIDHFASGLTTFDAPLSKLATNDKNYDSEIEKQIVELINTRVRPAVAMDGGDIVYKSFENGIVKLELRGACSGCPSSIVTLKNGIESMLKHYVPEVTAVEAINN